MILESVHRASLATPDKLAIAFYASHTAEPEKLSWAQLWEAVSKLGTRLSERFTNGDRLLLIFPQGIEFHLCQLACHYAGLVPVPVPLPSGSGGTERLQGIIADNQCAGILTLEKHEAAIASADASAGEAIPVIGIERLDADSVATIAPPYPATQEDLAFIQYTSGSVGTPKGVVVTHGNLNANVRMIGDGRDDATARICSWVPHFHDMGLIANFYEAMHVGGEFHLSSAESFVRRPLSWLRLLSRTKATSTTVPHFALTLCARLAHTLKPGEIDLSHMRLLVDSSEPVEWQGLEEFEQAFAPFGLARGTVIPHYGLAECTVMVTYPGSARPRFIDVDRAQFAHGVIELGEDESRSQRIVNCGRGLLDCAYQIVDPKTKKRLGSDRIGEVWITGSHVAQGYWGRPAESVQTFNQTIADDASGTLYVRSGDLGFVHDGDLFVTGRMKDVIIVRGQNYYARDIEVLAEHASPLVRAGRVVAIPLKHKGEETVGLLAEVSAKFDYRKDAAPFVAAFSRLLGEKLGLSAHAIVLVRRNSLPRTTSGKIRRADAAALYREGKLTSVFEYEASRFAASAFDKASFPGLQDRGTLLQWLEARVLDQAGVPSLSHEEDLFALGVDSLSMTNLLLEIEDATGRSLLEERFYAEPTLSTLADILTGHGEAETAQHPEETPSDPGPSPKPKRGWKKSLAWRLREFGPSFGPFSLSYSSGSRLLDRFLTSASTRERLARPFAEPLEALIAEQDIQDPERIRQEVTRAFAWTGWRETRLANPDTFASFVTTTGLERVLEARENGHGVILALVTTRLKGLYKFIPELTERPFGTIANLAPDRIEFYGLGPLAQRTGGKVSETVQSARVAQIHNAHKILRQGGTIGIFMDAFDGTGGIAVPMLGRKRPMRPGIAELALDTNSVVIPLDQRLHEGGRITFDFKPALAAGGETREERLLSLTLQLADSLEDIWRTNPGQMNDEAIRRQLALPKA